MGSGRGRRGGTRGRWGEGARESQGGKEGTRESLCTLPPSLALPHAPRERGKARGRAEERESRGGREKALGREGTREGRHWGGPGRESVTDYDLCRAC
jgi:hypothetical protein